MPEGGEANRILDGLDSRICPVQGCGKKVGSNAVFCVECWRAAPDLLKPELKQAARDSREVGAGGQTWRRWIETAVAIVRSIEEDV